MNAATRVRLYAALVVAAGFVVLSIVAVGVGVHDWFETRDSIRYWEEKAVAAPPGAQYGPRDPNPTQRLEAEKRELARIEESFVAPLVVGTLFGVLIHLVWRKKLRRRVAGM